MTIMFNVVSVAGQKFSISVLGPDDKVHDIKERIQEMSGISKEMIMLVYKGQKLENSATIAQCNIEAGVTINMVLSLRGGSSV